MIFTICFYFSQQQKRSKKSLSFLKFDFMNDTSHEKESSFLSTLNIIHNTEERRAYFSFR